MRAGSDEKAYGMLISQLMSMWSGDDGHKGSRSDVLILSIQQTMPRISITDELQ